MPISEETALYWSDIANAGLLAAGILGVAASGLAYWMNTVKDRYANARIAELAAQAETAKSEVARANENAASANLRTAQLQLDLEKERQKRAARVLSKEQYDTLQELRGIVSHVNITPASNLEAQAFASLIASALMDAGIEVRLYPSPPGHSWTGTYVYSPNRPSDPREDRLTGPFYRAELYGGDVPMSMLPDGAPTDIPMIFVGEKYLDTSSPVYIPPPTTTK
jgi:hypothetical protein